MSEDYEIDMELDQLREFRAAIDRAHDAHLATGDYLPLGIAAQNALMALRRRERSHV